MIEATAQPRLVRSETGGPLKPGDTLVGDELKIQLLKEIGEGSFAKVYEAVETETKLVMAAKIFVEGDDNASSHEARMELAQHEYNVNGFLTHDNIIRVHGLLLTGSSICILLELLPKGDLFGQVQPGYGLEAKLAIGVVAGLSSALTYLHNPAIGMVHLDIKPENILLGENDEPKLCDFDTAMKIGSTPSTMRGTPEYAAPESMPTSPEYWALRESTDDGGFPIHPALDVWALGLVGYFVMFGDYCWGAADREDEQYSTFLEGAHMTDGPWCDMPPSLVNFFNRTLDGRQEFRASASEIFDTVGPDWVQILETMRNRAISHEPLPEADVETMAALNQSDNWQVALMPKFVGKVTMYDVSVVPPREVDMHQRIALPVRYSRLLQLHQIASQRFPPPVSMSAYAVRPLASFPGKKRFGNKSSKFVEQRRLELMEYFRVTFMSADRATFWYDTLRELQYQQETGLADDDVYHGGD